ncbi:Lpg1974 family pore-forming outer membrane protein [Hyphomicrobium sp. CS1GBMeth3]|uniref:Lpg1974 family pore-forming outer membrane protein n=1 Tax=Hyphomicrobium sp. CS1GBMeth3 TaxID=1892845 RepID=UPI001114C1D6|nr:Lpg1974 family pore-forming outer membrane protein [Hyphomicrobium sp. CS1GBMeth3]
MFGASDFEVGYRPSEFDPGVGSPVDLDDGDGWGGAFTLGYTWQNGWKAAVRYRRFDADDSGGPISPGLIAFLPGVPLAPDVPSGVPFPFADVHTKVDSETTFVDFEVGKDVTFAGGQLHLFGGLTYASIERDIALIEPGCGCPPLALLMANDFHGLGPKIGVRGSVPLSGGVNLVGGTSVALLFGSAKFASHINDPFVPSYFKAEDDRAVAAINGEAGLAFAVGPGALTIGYRIDAMLDALDTDQRVSDVFSEFGFPQIGDKDTDFVAHGPFARFAIPLAAVAN